MHPRIKLEAIPLKEKLQKPVILLNPKHDQDNFYVVEKPGLVRWFPKNSAEIGGTFLDIRQWVAADRLEDGLLNMAFDPQYPNRPYVYVYFTADQPKRNRLVRLTVSENRKVELDSALDILDIPHPRFDHNGGGLLFGPDGYLYLSVGDGQNLKKLFHKLQDRSTLYGALLRIDVSNSSPESPYSIPPNNPFVGASDQSRPEIYAYGFRNLWSFHFLPDGRIVGADVGQAKLEELTEIKKGKSHGWPILEGHECYKKANCQREQHVEPLASFSHLHMKCALAGFKYQGSEIKWLKGRYIFGDCFRGLFYIDQLESNEIQKKAHYLFPKLPVPDIRFNAKISIWSSLFEDSDGEIYAINYRGVIFKISPQNIFEKFLGWTYMLTAFW